MFSLLKSSTSSNQFCKKIAVSLYPRYLFVGFSVFCCVIVRLFVLVMIWYLDSPNWIIIKLLLILVTGAPRLTKILHSDFHRGIFLPYRDFAQRRHRQAFVLRNRGCSCIGPPIWVINISACVIGKIIVFPHPTSELINNYTSLHASETIVFSSSHLWAEAASSSSQTSSLMLAAGGWFGWSPWATLGGERWWEAEI